MAHRLEVAKKLGLNEYESKAYLCLLERGVASASSVSSFGGIPRARVYDVLASLEKKGFVEKKAVKPVSYFAVRPKNVVKKIEAIQRKNFEDSIAEIGGIAASLESQVAYSGKQGDHGQVILLSGWNNIYSKIHEKLSETKHEAVFSTTSKDSADKKRQVFAKKIVELEKKGVTVKFRHHQPSRQTGGAPSRYILFDDQAVLLFLNPPSQSPENDQAVLLENPFVAGFFRKK
ncbi:MAG: TrmB family transcriptional regulator [Candidatus Diapherotrites archaeon]|nr:TrmB family transcriptional regulator [Candidatus Diapherotrites archaeon]